MISETTQQVVNEVFPNLEIQDFGEHKAKIQSKSFVDEQLRNLANATANWSGCTWHLQVVNDEVAIVFEHIAFDAG